MRRPLALHRDVSSNFHDVILITIVVEWELPADPAHVASSE